MSNCRTKSIYLSFYFEGSRLPYRQPDQAGSDSGAHWGAEKVISFPWPDLSAVIREIRSPSQGTGQPQLLGLCCAGSVCRSRTWCLLERPWEGGHQAELGLPFWARGRGRASLHVLLCCSAVQQLELAVSLTCLLLRKHHA